MKRLFILRRQEVSRRPLDLRMTPLRLLAWTFIERWSPFVCIVPTILLGVHTRRPLGASGSAPARKGLVLVNANRMTCLFPACPRSTAACELTTSWGRTRVARQNSFSCKPSPVSSLARLPALFLLVAGQGPSESHLLRLLTAI